MVIRYPKWLEFLRSKAIKLFQNYSLPRWMVFGMDNFSVFLAFLFAYLLRFNFVLEDFSYRMAVNQALIALCVYAAFALAFRPFSGLIRHTTIIDIFHVLVSTSFSLVALLSLTYFSRMMGWSENLNIPISIILIHFVTITLYLFFVRIVIKIVYQLITSPSGDKKRVLIFGAGALGVIVKRLIQSDVKSEYQIAGFLDNDKKLQGKKINGIPVFNPKILSEEFLNKHKVVTLIFAINDISPSEKSEIIRSALNLGIEVRETPSVDTWLNGKLQIKQIQKVKLEDLLGRDPIKLNMKRISIGLTGKTILVTGAAGSIGSEIVRQLIRFNIKKLILVDQAETPVFQLEHELQAKCNDIIVELILADVTNFEKMEQVFQEYHPEIVFHAAAYKHVPLMEQNPHEAIRVNVGGIRIITDLSVLYGVKKFVMISTDKAVNPTNVMGASKRVCEMIVQMKAQQKGTKTQFVITRFGNVLGSNGSVIPIFSKQILEGGPITVTHPEITRYFMTIPEACQLVLEAGFMGKGGEIFVFEMGKPVKIADLAHQMIRLSGLVPGKDIKVVFSGLRPGEKLHEELLAENENTLPTHHPKIKIARVQSFDNKDLITRINTLGKNLYSLSKQEVIDFLVQYVPEFNSTNQTYNGKPEDEQYARSVDISNRKGLRTDQ
jgi:FlaA1/EpsC-like NDP-sugar epimerase